MIDSLMRMDTTRGRGGLVHAQIFRSMVGTALTVSVTENGLALVWLPGATKPVEVPTGGHVDVKIYACGQG
jgi:hypothetical protein